jgi:hypothetical protein
LSARRERKFDYLMRACERGGDAGGFEARVYQSVLRCRLVDQWRIGRQRLVERHDRRLGVDLGRDLFGEIFGLGRSARRLLPRSVRRHR